MFFSRISFIIYRLRERVFATKVLANISLVESDDRGGVELAACCRPVRQRSKTKRHIVHIENNNTRIPIRAIPVSKREKDGKRG